ncbi:ketopantoate reductase PanE/ApbA-domain-containing protein [Pyrenochaeta sp. MPI-SDFR-AT-0127]|nr:ketopantoate reductase PanE/ApbA-domain-containing protein [Pyrenochaeta sp. MPI-SDFR-AT-0127]
MRKIAIVGAGAVGSTWAVHLARAGHDVTVVARGSRLARIQEDGNAIVSKGKEKDTTTNKTLVSVATALDPKETWDLVFVSILAHQLDKALIAILAACHPSTHILFFFNTFASLESYRQAIGAERCLSGFPNVWASIEKDGTLLYSFPSKSVVSDETWTAIFIDAGIPCTLEKDMESWLRAHAAAQVGFLSVIVPTGALDRGAKWAEAYHGACVAHEAFALVRKLGNQIIPTFVGILASLPIFLLASLYWFGSRVPTVRKRAQAGHRWRDELINLSDSMIEQAPSPDDVRLIRQVRSRY